jgi:hypothetical protein
MTAGVIEVTEETEGSQLARVGQLFWSPTKLFTGILRNRSWWFPYLLTVVCAYALTFAAIHELGFEKLTMNAIHADAGEAATISSGATEEQARQAFLTAETTFKIGAYGGPALILLYNVGYALVLWFGLNTGAGGRAQFSAIFAVLLYADLIQDVKSLAATAVLYFDPDSINFNFQNPLGSNLGYYLGTNHAGWLHSLAEGIDAVTIWYLLMISWGCSVVAKLPKMQAAAVVFGIWLMIVSVRVAWEAITK